MRKDDHLLFEAYVDGITKRRGELAGNLMDIVRYGIPTKEEFIKIRQELHDKTKQILDRGTPATEEERARGRQLIGMIRSYRAQHPNDPPVVKNQHPYAEVNAEDAENEPHGYPQGMTAIQNLALNELKKHGFALTKISHADKERDKYPTVFMHKKDGPMHTVAEIDGMGTINGEPFKEYVAGLKNGAERYNRSSGLPPEDPEDPYYDTWQSIAQDHAGEDAEDAEGMSDAEYHKARKDAFEGAGEELGHGPIKVQLKKNTTIDCYKAGTVQGVRFAKGTIFNCDVNVGDYYECDTEEYGGVAVFPYDVTVLSGEENAENADEKKERDQRKWQMNKNRWAKWKMENPEAAAKHAARKAGKK